MGNLKQKILDLRLNSPDDINQLNDILEAIKQETSPKNYLISLLRLLENNKDFNFGMPGDVVRIIEKLYQDSDYFDLIIQSVERVPTEYNLWLMNRVMNSFDDDDKIRKGLAVFHKVKMAADSSFIQDIAQEFIDNFDE